MQTTQSQIKLNLPLPLKALLASKAQQFGIPMSSYIRHLIIQNVQNDIPTFHASKLTEEMYKKAIKDKNKAIKVKGDISQFLDNI